MLTEGSGYSNAGLNILSGSPIKGKCKNSGMHPVWSGFKRGRGDGKRNHRKKRIEELFALLQGPEGSEKAEVCNFPTDA